MGNRKYLPLKPKDIEKTLKSFGFTHKNTEGSHAQWEGYIDGQRRVVSIPQYGEIGSKNLLKNIFSQSGLSWKEFYK